MPLRLAVLASGRGSNLQAILDAIAGDRLDARVVGVFSDRASAGALERARRAGVPPVAVSPREFANRLAYDEYFFARVDAVRPDLIVCAGYMRLISQAQVDARPGRMLNIHPSLLPAFKGLHTHQQALEAGVDVHGASVHVVSPELDGGPVVAQARVPVLAGDDPASLAARVLTREHPLLLATLRLCTTGRLQLSPTAIRLDGEPLERPLQLNDRDELVPTAPS